jgi:hypothetical protein
MLVFQSQEDFYNWLPYDKDTLLEHVGVTAEEFYGRYVCEGVAELDRVDVSELMELLVEVAFSKCVECYS